MTDAALGVDELVGEDAAAGTAVELDVEHDHLPVGIPLPQATVLAEVGDVAAQEAVSSRVVVSKVEYSP